MLYSSLKDVFIFSNYCWESASERIRYIVLSLVKIQRIYYLEPPILGVTSVASLSEFYSPDGVIVLTPYLPLNTPEEKAQLITQELLDNFIDQENLTFYDCCYFTDFFWDYSKKLTPQTITYHIEQEEDLDGPLAQEASFIFSSRPLASEHCIHIPDGVDFDHFSQARLSLIKPEDISEIPTPRVGCYGIHDDELIEELARDRSDLAFIFLTAKGSIELPNVYYLGAKNFYSLPLYLSHMNIAITSGNEKQLMELLASGTPVIYCGEDKKLNDNLVLKAQDISEVLAQIDIALKQDRLDPYWIDRVDSYLQQRSWDHQVELMLSIQGVEQKLSSETETLIQ